MFQTSSSKDDLVWQLRTDRNISDETRSRSVTALKARAIADRETSPSNRSIFQHWADAGEVNVS